MRQLRVTSLFCGIGGLDLGFEWAGYEIAWASDIASVAVASYQLNFGRMAIAADISEVPIFQIPDTDVIIGGPPCQAFSLVGRRRPDDERGSLVFRFFDVVREKMPLAFVLENVPGMAASKINGRRLTDVLVEEFSELGYHVTQMKLNAADYLVPQLRRRVIIVGTLVGKMPPLAPKPFVDQLIGEGGSADISARSAIGDLGDPVAKGQMARYKDVAAPGKFASLMRARGNSVVSLHEAPRMSPTDRRLVSYIPPGGNYTSVPDEHATQRILNFKKTGGRTTTYGRLHPDRPSYTVNTYFRRPNVGSNFHYESQRLITMREAMRFQSIPDYFTIAPAAQDARNALIGNAVPPLLGFAIAKSLRSFLESHMSVNLAKAQARNGEGPAVSSREKLNSRVG